MKMQLNLASEPFRRDRAVLLGSSAMAAFLVALLALLISLNTTERRGMRDSNAQLTTLQSEAVRIGREQHRLDGELARAGNADVLERSLFLNALLLRKSISWSHLFTDLEKVVPSNVRVISIRPQVDPGNHIYLDMVVAAETQKPVIDLLAKFETSDVFGSTAVHGILPPSQTDPSFRYRITVNYGQKL